MTTAMTFPAADALQAIAARAFKPDVTLRGQTPDLDTRPLLPAYEAEIGRMMADSVPPHLRPKGPVPAGNGSEPLTERRARRMDIARGMSGTGATVPDLARALGLSVETAEQYARAVGGFDCLRPNSTELSRLARERAVALHQQGKTSDQIARAMRLTPKTVRGYLRIAGVAL